MCESLSAVTQWDTSAAGAKYPQLPSRQKLGGELQGNYLSMSIYTAMYLSTYLPTYLPIYLSVCLSIYLSICFLIHPSIHPSMHPSSESAAPATTSVPDSAKCCERATSETQNIIARSARVRANGPGSESSPNAFKRT